MCAGMLFVVMLYCYAISVGVHHCPGVTDHTKTFLQKSILSAVHTHANMVNPSTAAAAAKNLGGIIEYYLLLNLQWSFSIIFDTWFQVFQVGLVVKFTISAIRFLFGK